MVDARPPCIPFLPLPTLPAPFCACFSTLDTTVFACPSSRYENESKRIRKRPGTNRVSDESSPPHSKRRTFFFFFDLSLRPSVVKTAASSSSSSASASARLDPVTGKNLDGPDLSCAHPSGLVLPNPFVIGR